jgi:hypothetical protein
MMYCTLRHVVVENRTPPTCECLTAFLSGHCRPHYPHRRCSYPYPNTVSSSFSHVQSAIPCSAASDRAEIPPHQPQPKAGSGLLATGRRDWLAAAAGSKHMHVPSDAAIDKDNSALVCANELTHELICLHGCFTSPSTQIHYCSQSADY